MTATPTLSIGLAVKNAENVIQRCVESVLEQDFEDLELVVADNVSDDATQDLLEEYAHADARVRLTKNNVDIGSHENMNRVLGLSRGEFFRWISSDDWLEPGCLSTTIDALRSSRDAVGVTSFFTIHQAHSAPRREEYWGEFPDSPDAARRFERMLWFFHAGDAKYDPMYGMYRREVLMRSHRLRPSQQTDWLLAAELALTGPILNVPRVLANRTRSYPVLRDEEAFRRRLDPMRGEELRSSLRRLYRDLAALIPEASLDIAQTRRCQRALRRFIALDAVARARAQAARSRAAILAR